MQQGIKKLQWLEYLKVVFLEILNLLLCRVFANQVTYSIIINECSKRVFYQLNKQSIVKIFMHTSSKGNMPRRESLWIRGKLAILCMAIIIPQEQSI